MTADDKQQIFEGSLAECQDYGRANRFNVLFSGMEIRDSKHEDQFIVVAYRNDTFEEEQNTDG